jgi:hypothetical protein
MGLKGYRLWVMGYGLWVNLIQPAEPHRGVDEGLRPCSHVFVEA